MSRSSPPYNAISTPTFKRQLRKLRKKSLVRANRIEDAVKEIVQLPYQNIDFGKGEYRGKRKRRVGDDRIIFVVCKQCRELGHQVYNQCGDCDSTPDETVILVSIIEQHRY